MSRSELDKARKRRVLGHRNSCVVLRIELMFEGIKSWIKRLECVKSVKVDMRLELSLDCEEPSVQT